MIKEIKHYNNGNGCSCCRKDETVIREISKEEMIPFEALMTETVNSFKDNCENGGLVGIEYRENGKLLYGVVSAIEDSTFGQEATLCNKNGNEISYDIKGYEFLPETPSFTPKQILDVYYGKTDAIKIL